MIYITIANHTRQNIPQQSTSITIEDLLRGVQAPSQISYERQQSKKMLTYAVERTDEEYQKRVSRYNIQRMRQIINDLATHYEPILEEDMSSQYETFFIPKRSGGMRRIDAPKRNLMSALRDITSKLEYELYLLPHNAAHAYTKQRSTITALKVHQERNNKWFLKIDLKDFFPKHNYEYIMRMLEQIFPFSEIMQDSDSKENLGKLIKLGLLNDVLPQGTPLSPLLTNILMIPIDYHIVKTLRESEQRINFTYTRYADDLLISAPFHFNKELIQTAIINVLREFDTPFSINADKTRYGSLAGRNWNLGIMLNKDNKMTIGHKQNQRFRAAVNNFLRDLTTNNTWSKLDVQVLVGQISYYKAIQPEYVAHVIETYSRKYHINFNECVKRILNMPEPQ